MKDQQADDLLHYMKLMDKHIGLNAESSHTSFQTLEKITLDISRR